MTKRSLAATASAVRRWPDRGRHPRHQRRGRARCHRSLRGRRGAGRGPRLHRHRQMVQFRAAQHGRPARQGRAGQFLDLWLRQLRQRAAACGRAQQKYKDRGLVIVGVHTPEFPFERSASNVQAALKRHGITYPVAQDNDSQTWNAYRNQYWPAQYIIDQNGKIVFQHAGEGQYEQIDRTIARLLERQQLSRRTRGATPGRRAGYLPFARSRYPVSRHCMIVKRHDPTLTDGADVRGLGCRGAGAGAVRLHDVVSHRVSRLLDRACQLPRGAGGALAVDRARGLHQPVQLLAEDFRHRVRHGRGVGHRDVLPVRHQLVGVLRQDRPGDRPPDGL